MAPQVLMPMHKMPTLHIYSRQLINCVTFFLEKDPALTCPVVGFLIRFWPRSCSRTELIFLEEVEDRAV